MLNAANKYKFVPTAGHNISGVTVLKNGQSVLRWESVAWANEAVGELSAELGISGLVSYTVQPYLSAHDIQRVISWCSAANTATNSATVRHLTSWLPSGTGWVKIKDYVNSVTSYSLKNNIYTAGNEASATRYSARFGSRKTLPIPAAVATGDALTCTSLLSILQALPTHYQGVSGRITSGDIALYGSYTVTDLAGGSPWGSSVLFRNNPPEAGDASLSPSIYKYSAKYKSTTIGSPDVVVETDSTLGSPITLDTLLGASAAVSEINLVGAEAVAVSYRQVYDGSTSRFSASTYYCQLLGNSFNQFNVAADLFWSNLKALTAPAIARPSAGTITEGVLIFSVGGMASLRFNCATSI